MSGGSSSPWTISAILRTPRPRDMKVWDWRRTAPIRPVVFKDPGHIDDEVVHLHLEHRLVQRLLGRFLAQGFVLDDLARACVGMTDDAQPRVLLLGRMSLYGDRAARLHDEIVWVAAPWSPLATRKGALKPYAEADRDRSWELLMASLANARGAAVAAPVRVVPKRPPFAVTETAASVVAAGSTTNCRSVADPR